MSIHTGARRSFSIAVLALSLSSCQDSDYLHYNADLLPPPPPFEKSFAIKEIAQSRKLDILWVIDNSGSMGPSQQSVIKNADLFMQKFTQKKYLEWKMGVISTALEEAPYLGFTPPTRLDATTPDPVGKARDAVAKLGTSGDATERAFDPVLRQLEKFPDFLRPKSFFSMIIVTDAEEQSRVDTAQFLSELKKIKQGENEIRAYGVLADLPSGCYNSQENSPLTYKGSRYEELILKTNGKFFSLCSDFAQSLSEIGDDMVKFAQSNRIYLDKRPLVKTLEVTHRGVILPQGMLSEGGMWIYDPVENAIVFHNLDFAPDAADIIHVHFEEDIDRRPGQ